MDTENKFRKVREPIVSGIFYPEDGKLLKTELDKLLPEGKGGKALGILSPHAGYSYSGTLSALSWHATSARQVETVVILSPLHREKENVLFLPESEAFDTPLGAIPIDTDLVSELQSCSMLFSINDIPHLEEHAIEVQLPFMKALFPNAKLLPVIMGMPTLGAVKALAGALQIVFADRLQKTLFVVSSNLTAYLHDAAAKKIADLFLSLIEKKDWEGICDFIEVDNSAACGAGCVAAFLAVPFGRELGVRLLGRTDSSSHRASTNENLVHYAAIAFEGKGKEWNSP